MRWLRRSPPRMSASAMRVVLGCLSLCWAVAGGADLYRSVDEDGVTVYSQSPPASGDAIRLRPPSGPSQAEAEAARERLRRQLEAEQDAHEDAAMAVEQAGEAAGRERQQAACEAARQNQATLEGIGARMLRTPDGELKLLSEEERAALLRETRDQIELLCH